MPRVQALLRPGMTRQDPAEQVEGHLPGPAAARTGEAPRQSAPGAHREPATGAGTTLSHSPGAPGCVRIVLLFGPTVELDRGLELGSFADMTLALPLDGVLRFGVFSTSGAGFV